MNRLFYLLFLFILLTANACRQNNSTVVRVLKVTEHGSAKVTDEAVINVVERETDLKVEISYDLDEVVALEKLRNRTIDMAIIPSNTYVQDAGLSIRTVLPLLPRLLMIVTRPGTEATSLKSLLENNLVFFADMSRMDSVFFEKLFLTFNVNPAKVEGRISENINNDKDTPPSVFIGLTHLNNPFVLKLLDEGWSLFSLDNVSNFGRGSSAEGFQMTFPWAYPFIFPKSFYEGKPEEPVLSVAIRDVLVVRADFDDEIVYKLVKTLIEHKTSLVRQNNIYQLLPTEIDKQNLSFPLSKGTLHYLNRDKPSIWFRYANMIWPLLSVIAILVGAMASFQQHLKKQLKERADTYYAELFKVRSKAIDGGDNSLNEELMRDLLEIRNRAFNAVKKNKLLADESFSIFLTLYQEIASEIKQMSESRDR